jgi:hypothetical protein
MRDVLDVEDFPAGLIHHFADVHQSGTMLAAKSVAARHGALVVVFPEALFPE